MQGTGSMIKNTIVKIAADRQLLCLILVGLSVQPAAVCATESRQTLSASAADASSSGLVEDSPRPEAVGGSARILLNGGVEVFQPHSLIGRWNGHVKRFGRHPKLDITHCQDGQIAGTYKGIFGTFPLTGQYDGVTGDITIHVDFSSSRMAKFKRLRSGHGIIEANIQNGVLIGKASISDLGDRSVRWEAVKESNKIMDVQTPFTHEL